METSLVGAFACIAGLCALTAAQARADCASPELKLLWSYPEDGAVDVPIDAGFWALTSQWGAMPTATLDGEAIEVDPNLTFSATRLWPDALEPDTDHLLVLEYTDASEPSGASKRFEIGFRTGSGAVGSRRPDPPAVTRDVAVSAIGADPSCPEIIAAQDCFDTGQNTYLTFEVSDDPDALGWLVSHAAGNAIAVLPARCDAPTIFVHGGTQACFAIQTLGDGGVLSEPTQHCTQGDADETTARHKTTELNEGCRVRRVARSRTSRFAFVVLGALAVFAGVRRRRRNPRS